MICALAYAMVQEGRDEEGRKAVDEALGLLATDPSESRMVEKQLSDGRVIQLSEARLARIRENFAGFATMRRR